MLEALFVLRDSCSYKQADTFDYCNSRTNLRRIDLIHPYYSESSREIKICESHFLLVFGPTLDLEKSLLRTYLGLKSKYYRDFNLAKKTAEYFNENDYKVTNYRKVDDAYKKYETVKRLECRHEICNQKLFSVRKKYTIRIYKPSGLDQQLLAYCSQKCWDKMNRRIGLLADFKVNKILPMEKFF